MHTIRYSMDWMCLLFKKAALEEGLEIFSEYDFLKLKALPQISKQFDKIIDRDFIRETLKRYV